MPKQSNNPSIRFAKPALAILILGAFCWVFSLRNQEALARTTTEARPAATIIPNVDDDDGDGRLDCSADIPNPALDDDLLQIRLGSTGPLPDGVVLKVEVAKPWDRFTRIFLVDPVHNGLARLQPSGVAYPKGTKPSDLTLALEATDFAGAGHPSQFDLKVRFEAEDGRTLSEETIPISVAPFLLSCCLDPAEAVHVVKTGITGDFVAGLAPLVRAAGASLDVVDDPALPSHDIWVQDATEIGYATDGKRLMHVALQGNRGLKLDALFIKKFLGKDRGTVHKGGDRGKSAEWIDWFGNLEVSPPVTVKGREFKKGRFYAGTQSVRAMHPDVIAFLEAQGAQGPVLWLDTSWLVIGHVDETVSWVPSKVGKPFRMLIPSPRLAVEILRKAEQDAPGVILNRGTKRQGDKPGQYERPVASVLGDADLMAKQEYVQKKIDGVRQTLQSELGVADNDIIEIPVLFNSSLPRFAGRFDAETTNMVNSLLVGDTLIVPDPHGPLVNGRDVLLQAVKDRLEPIGCRVLSVDNFFPYHRWLGEVHCGTNATRRPPHER